MIVHALRLVLFLAGVSTLVRATPLIPLPLRDGEQLTYRVNWAIVPGAGEIKIAARQDPSGPKPTLVVTSNTATRRLARVLLPFDAEASSVFEVETGKMISLHETSAYKGKRGDHTVTFDHERRIANYVVKLPPESPRELPIPPGNPTDIIMGLLQTRTWDLEPGQKRDALVLFGDDFYELTIHIVRREEVKTPLGKFQTLVLEPRMEKTPPKGMFRRGSSVRVWISQDDLRLPVKFEVEFKIGTGVATLESYVPPTAPRQPPATAKPADAAAESPRS